LAFITAAISAFLSIRIIQSTLLFLRRSPESGTEDAAPLAYVLVPLAWICLITLGGIAFTAGMDLWRMRSQGRKLAIASMVLLLPLGVLFAALPEDEWGIKLMGIGICVVCSVSILYLFLPGIRILFDLKVGPA
jgi:hypothetical protein